jgi:hypothetical protein
MAQICLKKMSFNPHTQVDDIYEKSAALLPTNRPPQMAGNSVAIPNFCPKKYAQQRKDNLLCQLT